MKKVEAIADLKDRLWMQDLELLCILACLETIASLCMRRYLLRTKLLSLGSRVYQIH
jgi:hypothetical protein